MAGQSKLTTTKDLIFIFQLGESPQRIVTNYDSYETQHTLTYCLRKNGDISGGGLVG